MTQGVVTLRSLVQSCQSAGARLTPDAARHSKQEPARPARHTLPSTARYTTHAGTLVHSPGMPSLFPMVLTLTSPVTLTALSTTIPLVRLSTFKHPSLQYILHCIHPTRPATRIHHQKSSTHPATSPRRRSDQPNLRRIRACVRVYPPHPAASLHLQPATFPALSNTKHSRLGLSTHPSSPFLSRRTPALF